MKKFSVVEPKIKAAALEDTQADFYQRMLREGKPQSRDDQYFIKQNKKTIGNIAEAYFENQERACETARSKKERETRYEGKLPAYLVKKKMQGEIDKKIT